MGLKKSEVQILSPRPFHIIPHGVEPEQPRVLVLPRVRRDDARPVDVDPRESLQQRLLAKSVRY